MYILETKFLFAARDKTGREATHDTHVRFEILSAVTMRDTLFQNLTPSSPIEFQPRFVEMYKRSKQETRGKKEAERMWDTRIVIQMGAMQSGREVR
jgi:hypothetical protein